jgi:hypothetical protein
MGNISLTLQQAGDLKSFTKEAICPTDRTKRQTLKEKKHARNSR